MPKEEVEEVKRLLDRIGELAANMTKEEEDEIDQYLDEQGWPDATGQPDQEDSGPPEESASVGVLALP